MLTQLPAKRRCQVGGGGSAGSTGGKWRRKGGWETAGGGQVRGGRGAAASLGHRAFDQSGALTGALREAVPTPRLAVLTNAAPVLVFRGGCTGHGTSHQALDV